MIYRLPWREWVPRTFIWASVGYLVSFLWLIFKGGWDSGQLGTAGLACVFSGTFASIVSREARAGFLAWHKAFLLSSTTLSPSCLQALPTQSRSSHRCSGFLCLVLLCVAFIISFALCCVMVGGRSWIHGDGAMGACEVRLPAFWGQV